MLVFLNILMLVKKLVVKVLKNYKKEQRILKKLKRKGNGTAGKRYLKRRLRKLLKLNPAYEVVLKNYYSEDIVDRALAVYNESNDDVMAQQFVNKNGY